ncbi:hypothetical protein N7539_003996 [Penicillium diatomitis]|uniref:Zn(2)-C6 fungal-type domain-containing protein n=1 Tax=Penicillium diatomitis TaxID=2819901 RepID=A0A9W9XDA2_9EURO|nr:uncharacterized protein N7539_003996 [Penicillium diatomitis]KAJ5489106.1 hypothetical protein N7539_003996 [Penicillium diatomitis]
MSVWPNDPGGNARYKVAIPRVAGRPAIAKRQRVTRACDACRVIKLKCNGKRPSCGYCITVGEPCLYSASKREALQIDLHRLEDKVQDYESTLSDILLNCPPTDLKPMLKLLSQRRPELLAAFRTSKSLPRSYPSLKYTLNLERMHLGSRGNTAAGLILRREPLIQTTSMQYWSSVVEDDVASHLLSLYFAWENPTWHIVDQELFLHDLETRSTRFCSPLLAHIMMLYGCSLSYSMHSFTDRRQEKVLSQKLYEEILRLWELEKERLDVPTLQSGILLGLLCCTFGTDRVGMELVMRGASLYYRLGLHEEGAPYYDCINLDLKVSMARAQKLVSWGIFDVQALCTQVYRKPSAWPKPPSMGFSPDEAMALDEQLTWSPYPFQSPIFAAQTYMITRLRCGLATLVNQVSILALSLEDSQPTKATWIQACEIHRNLRQWERDLPAEFLLARNSTPHALCLRMTYQCTMISLCDIFEGYSIEQSHGYSDFDPALSRNAAIEAHCSILLLYKHFHGWKSVPIVMLHFSCVAGIHAITRIGSPGCDDLKWTRVLESSVVGLWNMAVSWGRLGKAFLRLIAFMLKSQSIRKEQITKNTSAIMDQLDGTYWTATDTASLAADYVVYSIASNSPASPDGTGKRLTPQSIEEMIKAAEQLTL